jgi:hypothetical protein
MKEILEYLHELISQKKAKDEVSQLAVVAVLMKTEHWQD